MSSKDELEQQIAELRNELEQLKDAKRDEYAQTPDTHQKPKTGQNGSADDNQHPTSRRAFLKKAGALGAAGLGATILGKHASAYQIRSGNPFTVANQAGDINFEVGTDGTLDLQANDISNAGSISADSATVTNAISAGSIDTDRGAIAGVEFIAATDDAQAIIEAASEGTMFFLERGATWDVADITIPRGCTLFGGGNAGDVASAATASSENPPKSTLRKAADGNIVNISHNTSFIGIEFDGNRGNGYTGDGVVDRQNDVNQPYFRGCYIHHTEGDGRVRDGSDKEIFVQGKIKNCEYAVRAISTGSAFPHHATYRRTSIRDNRSGGVRYDAAPWDEKYPCRIISNGGPAFEFRTNGGREISQMQFTGSYSNNDGPAIYQNGAGRFEAPDFGGHYEGNAANPSVTATAPVGGAIHIESGASEIQFGTMSTGRVNQPGAGASASISNQGPTVWFFNLTCDGRNAASIEGSVDVITTQHWGGTFNGRNQLNFSTGGTHFAINGNQVVNEQQSGLTPADGSTVDSTYGTEERDVIQNLVTRVNQLEDRLQSHGLIQ